MFLTHFDITEKNVPGRGDVAFQGGIYIHCLQVEEKFWSSTRMKNKGALAIDKVLDM